MAVELQELYEKIRPLYDVRLRTKSCYQKVVEWFHMVEGVEFVPLLHGDELAFNSGLNYTSDEWLWDLIRELHAKEVVGLILTMHHGQDVPEEIIEYCDEISFPLITAAWETPYVDIMRMFSVILLKNSEKETNLIEALKNAIYYADNEEIYRNHFIRHGYLDYMNYNIVIISCHTYDQEQGNLRLKEIETKIKQQFKNIVSYEEDGNLIVLFVGRSKEEIQKYFQKICSDDRNIYAGMGTRAFGLREIHCSYERARTAYQLTKTAIQKNFLSYDELGVYKIISDIKEKTVCKEFVEEVLGKIIAHDKKYKTKYLEVLEAYFENDCSIIHTAEAMFFHVNTMKYKLNKIKDILNYDILTSENRMKIMLAFYMLRAERTEDFPLQK